MINVEIILFLLALVAISTVLDQFLRSCAKGYSVLIPIILGIVSTFFLNWLGFIENYKIVVEPDLFFCVFIAPLLFIEAKNSKKQELIKYKRSILLLAFGLVFLTVLIVGGVLNSMISTFPLAICCALGAALAPTDAVSVEAVRAKVRIPKRIEHILEGEALINDASGLVTFSFALLMAKQANDIGFTWLGKSALDFTLMFLYVVIVGVLVGLVFTFCKSFIQNIFRKRGIENPALYVLLEVMTPFLIYIIGENLEASGILAVVTSGIIHSFFLRQTNPETAKIKMTTKTTWEMISYVLNGMVFILLGLQIPYIIREVWLADTKIVVLLAIGLVIALVLYLLRFVWSFVTVRPKISKNQGKPTIKEHAKNSLIVTLCGAKGAVTLATIMSLPLSLEMTTGATSAIIGGTSGAIVHREQIIFLAVWIIIISLLVANYILPLIAPAKPQKLNTEKSIELDILVKVMREMQKENRFSQEICEILLANYRLRISRLNREVKQERFQNSSLQKRVMNWQKNEIIKLVESGNYPPRAALQTIRRLDKELSKSMFKDLKKIYRHRKKGKSLKFRSNRIQFAQEIHDGQIEIDKYVLKKLENLARTCEIPQDAPKTHLTMGSDPDELDLEELQILIDEYRIRVQENGELNINKKINADSELRKESEIDLGNEYNSAFMFSLQIERNIIGKELTNGKISLEHAHRLFKEIDIMEYSLSL
ncbi:MAG: sodium:proton antiporter [Candidatus Ancillula sp.]|jgi:CPA1 family monovalent cation:H+ antiporter|nr:sodium:proton antiporter [Candidatus Ancillula sp.]